MKDINWKNPLMLFMTAAIWGVAFVAQSIGMDYIGPFTFSCVRCIIGGFVLLPCIWLLGRWEKKRGPEEKPARNPKDLALGGVCCGVVLCLAANMQQIAIQYTTVGKAGFITALYIVIVPVMGLFLKKKCGMRVWVSVAIATVGFYLLSMTGGQRLGLADLCLLGSAVMFSVHILVIDHFSPLADGVKMSCIQFFVCGILSGIVMLITETPSLSAVLAAWSPVLYSGVLSCGGAYTLQILGQKDYNPTIASLILSLESVFSALAGWVILHQALSRREILGCVLIFCAIILAQIRVNDMRPDLS